MRSILLLVLALISIAYSDAQVAPPQHPFSPSDNGASLGWYTIGGSGIQGIYYPSNFPGMPAGVIKNIYLKSGINTTVPPPSSYTYYGFRIRMKNTELTGYPHGGSTVRDTIIPFTQGDIVANYPIRTITGPVVEGDWVKVPLNTGNFYYSGGQKFVVQVELDSIGATGGFFFRVATITSPNYRMGKFLKDSIQTVSEPRIFDIGFDLTPTGVNELTNITSFGLFPNPSTDGRFNVSFDAKQKVREIEVTITNAIGQQVLQRHYQSGSTSFFKEVDASMLAKGSYFVTTKAGEDQVVRTLIIR